MTGGGGGAINRAAPSVASLPPCHCLLSLQLWEDQGIREKLKRHVCNHVLAILTLCNVCSVYRGDTVSTSGDIMSTSGAIMILVGGYHEYIGGYHEYIGGVQYIGGYHEYIEGCSVHRSFQYKLKGFCHLAPPHAS